jgi:hypothetical protein
MEAPVQIGLCVTSHAAGEQRTYEFDNISTSGGVSGDWQGAVISSPRHNSSQPLYVTVEDGAGKTATVIDGDAVAAAAWTEVRIPLADFAGVNLSNVARLVLGVGDPADPAPGGAGRIYIDDIRVVRPAPADQ